MTLTRKTMIRELRSMLPGARGRAAVERMVRRLTDAELVAATGFKPRIRVKAVGRHWGR